MTSKTVTTFRQTVSTFGATVPIFCRYGGYVWVLVLKLWLLVRTFWVLVRTFWGYAWGFVCSFRGIVCLFWEIVCLFCGIVSVFPKNSFGVFGGIRLTSMYRGLCREDRCRGVRPETRPASRQDRRASGRMDWLSKKVQATRSVRDRVRQMDKGHLKISMRIQSKLLGIALPTPTPNRPPNIRNTSASSGLASEPRDGP
jgi:hypothetical protein